MKKLFGRIFGSQDKPQEPVIRFGRYSDSYRSAQQEAAFDAALVDFEKGNYLAAYVSFFQYLQDEAEQNVKAWEEKGQLHFELFQGSKKVAGYANPKKLYAEARIAKVLEPKSSFMRRLLEENFELKYSRFAFTPDHEIAILFDTYTTDGSPYKLYAALKELATHADKHDDILVDEFSSLEVTNFHTRRELPMAEKEVKHAFITREINAVFHEIDHAKLNWDQYPVAMTYMLLHLCYKIDYLTKPEGHTMEALERIHRLTYSQDEKKPAQKNLLLRKEFQKLLDRPKEKFFAEMYEVSATFGITGSIDHAKVVLVIDQELSNMKWYKDNGHTAVALAIPGFIVGRLLFNFAVPPPDKDLLHLFFQVTECAYFEQLGYPPLCSDGLPNEKNIRLAIRKIVEKHEACYPNFAPNPKLLRFDSMVEFAESHLLMLRGLDLTKA